MPTITLDWLVYRFGVVATKSTSTASSVPNVTRKTLRRALSAATISLKMAIGSLMSEPQNETDEVENGRAALPRFFRLRDEDDVALLQLGIAGKVAVLERFIHVDLGGRRSARCIAGYENVAEIGLCGRAVADFGDRDAQAVAVVELHGTRMVDRADDFDRERRTRLHVYDGVVRERDIEAFAAVAQE